jgi:hypothetical protein
MQASITGNSVTAMPANAQPERGTANPPRLWSSLVAAWTRRLDRQIEQELRWLDHGGVMEDFRSASRG